MINSKILNLLKQSNEQTRVNFFFGAIVAKTWNVLTLEDVLSRRQAYGSSLETILAQVSQFNALGSMISRMSSLNSFGPDVRAKVNQYRGLPIHERINQVTQFEAEVLVLDRNLVDCNPIVEIFNKDHDLYVNTKSLVSTYAAAIYDTNDTANALQKLNAYRHKLANNPAIPHYESEPLLRMFVILSAALIDPHRQLDFVTIFQITLQMEINLFAGLNKSRKFLLETHAEVNQPQWNSVKSKTTFFGNGKTPGGIAAIRRTLEGITDKELPNEEVKTLLSAVQQLLKTKLNNKPMKRTDNTHSFYATKSQEADALLASEVQPFIAAAQRNNRRP